MSKFYITTPIYYASADPHVGHAMATLYADTIVRYRKSKGDDIFFLVGTDEHGSKIAEKAEEQGIKPQAFVDAIATRYQTIWAALYIRYDIFMRTTSEKHLRGVKMFFERLHESGDIYEGSYEGLYCIGCEDFITETKLIDGLCPDHLKAPEKVKEKNYFFNLKKHLPRVREKIASDELRVTPETRKNEILRMIDAGIPDFAITRDRTRVGWGIPYFYDDTQTIYVWGDALLNYVTALDFPEGDAFNKFWPADIHLVGSDINKFHSIYWPAMLLSAGLPLPRMIFVHGLFTVNGQKMSKTLGNIIDPHALINEFGADATRYLLLSQFPATEYGDVKQSEFSMKYNANLANGIGNLLQRVLAMIIAYRPAIDERAINEKVARALESFEARYTEHMDGYALFEALQVAAQTVAFLDAYINETEPWKMNQMKDARLSLVLSSLLYGIRTTVRFLMPFMPIKMKQAQDLCDAAQKGMLSPEPLTPLFPRIENGRAS